MDKVAYMVFGELDVVSIAYGRTGRQDESRRGVNHDREFGECPVRKFLAEIVAAEFIMRGPDEIRQACSVHCGGASLGNQPLKRQKCSLDQRFINGFEEFAHRRTMRDRSDPDALHKALVFSELGLEGVHRDVLIGHEYLDGDLLPEGVDMIALQMPVLRDVAGDQDRQHDLPEYAAPVVSGALPDIGLAPVRPLVPPLSNRC